ncbi:MAG: phosphatase PAP2 family protein [Dehalococcoidia bacterium]
MTKTLKLKKIYAIDRVCSSRQEKRFRFDPQGAVVLRTITKEVALIGACYLTFALAKNLTDPSPVFKAVVNGWGVIRLESALSLNQESFIQQVIGRISVGALVALTYFYAVGMWLGLSGTAILLFIKNRAAYLDLRRTFVLTMVLGAIVFAMYPLAPPRFMPGLGMTDTVSLLGLDPSPSSDSVISYNRFAAMPSLHYAWALLIMIGVFKLGGIWFKLGGFLYQALMFVAIIATANHYILDAVAGAILLAVAIYMLRWWNHYEPQLSNWTQIRVARAHEMKARVRMRVGQIVIPDLREQLFSGFILRGGHAIQPDRSKLSPIPTINSGGSGIQGSFHPELDDLVLVLR